MQQDIEHLYSLTEQEKLIAKLKGIEEERFRTIKLVERIKLSQKQNKNNETLDADKYRVIQKITL